MSKVIEVKNLVKSYKKLNAVDGISFYVNEGEVFGLLGENGAGKTTTLEIIEGLRKATQGEVKVLGHDVKHELNDIKEQIGVQLQSTAYYHFLTLREILNLFASFYKKSIDPEELLHIVGLKHKAKVYVNALSGGQRQRFSIIASLVNDPKIVFLDEPTTGLDPIARRRLWELITKIKSQGKTIVLTTHYMEEAEMLCDRIGIMDKGKLLAIDETHKLIERAKNPYTINFLVKELKEDGVATLEKVGKLEKVLGKEKDYSLKLKSADDLNKALDCVQKLNPLSLTVGRAKLEDVFVELTGKSIDE
ncbi:MAG: ABC transporter ATP-binding protein [Patescibacteria group bacterium]